MIFRLTVLSGSDDSRSMQQVQKTKESQSQTEEEIPDVPAPETDPEIEAHKHISDEILDEIDSLLEENAETFVREFIQRGGE